MNHLTESETKMLMIIILVVGLLYVITLYTAINIVQSVQSEITEMRMNMASMDVKMSVILRNDPTMKPLKSTEPPLQQLKKGKKQ